MDFSNFDVLKLFLFLSNFIIFLKRFFTREVFFERFEKRVEKYFLKIQQFSLRNLRKLNLGIYEIL